jgi:hypothetical protein
MGLYTKQEMRRDANSQRRMLRDKFVWQVTISDRRNARCESIRKFLGCIARARRFLRCDVASQFCVQALNVGKIKMAPTPSKNKRKILHNTVYKNLIKTYLGVHQQSLNYQDY